LSGFYAQALKKKRVKKGIEDCGFLLLFTKPGLTF
jgi:hypothetical protein